MADTDVMITPEEQARRLAMLSGGLKSPILDPNRAPVASVAAPNITPSGPGLLTPVLGGQSTDLRSGPQSPEVTLPTPPDLSKIPTRGGVGNRLAEIGLGLFAGLPAAEAYANKPREMALQQYEMDRQHALDVAGQQQKTLTEEVREGVADINAQARLGAATTAADARIDVATTNQTGATTREGMKDTTATIIENSKEQSAWNRLKETDKFKTWQTQQDNATKIAVAKESAGKAPAAIMQTAEFANGGLDQLSDAQDALAKLKAHGVVGSWATNKLEDAIFGSGAVDPNLSAEDKQLMGKVRAALTYTSSAAMRAHTGRTSREIYDDFKATTQLGQGLDALEGALGQTQHMLQTYAGAASDAAIARMRAGQSVNQTDNGAPPPGAKVRTYDPATGTIH